MSEEMKPCPFCGGKVVIRNYGMMSSAYEITCESCELAVVSDFWEEEDAIKAWNTRAEPIEQAAKQMIPREGVENLLAGLIGVHGLPPHTDYFRGRDSMLKEIYTRTQQLLKETE